MAYKKLGPDVSESPAAADAGAGQYTADEHSFESVVFQQDKPVLDWELNLLQEILGQAGSRLLALKTLPTCVLNGDFLETPNLVNAYALLSSSLGSAYANQFIIGAQDLIVNGWPIRFDYSGSAITDLNLIQLDPPPGSGNRTDLVILEVWRALIAAAPSTLNKSLTGQILRNGNAKAGDQFPPGNVNLADDLLDPSMLVESQKRVQIQYRYRVISGAAFGTNDIDGFGDLLSRSVPYQNASGPDGEPPLSPLPYVSMSGAGGVAPASSTGLWRAGAGNAADALALGTVDGFMYAVPLCAVFRRNSAAFDEVSNRNGAPLLATGDSPRADHLFADQIAEGDILDLRHGAAWDFNEVLDKNFQYVLDNTLVSHHEMFIDGASTVGGTSFSVGDDIGLGSQSFGQADGVRSHFSDRAVTEACIHKQSVVAVTSVTVPLSAIVSPWGTTQDVVAHGPAGTHFSGVNKVRMVDASLPGDYDMFDSGSPQQVSSVVVSDASVTVNFVGTVSGTLYVELLVTYPGDVGMRRNVVEVFELWTPPPASMASWVEPAFFSAGVSPHTLPSGRYTISQSTGGSPTSGQYWWTDISHRELTFNVPGQGESALFYATADGVVMIPDRVSVANSNTLPYVVTSFGYNGVFTVVTFSPAPPPGTAVTMTYTPFRPPPYLSSGTDKYTLWYRTRAIQTVEPRAGTQTLRLTPRAISKQLHVILSGSGGPDDSFPYDAPGAQIPITIQPAASNPESSMDSPGLISMPGFGANSGYAQIPVIIPYSPNPSFVTLFRDALDDVVDGDGRRYWPKSDDGGFPVYPPSAFGQAFSNSSSHKVVLPTVCELQEDVPTLGVRGTMVLVVFSRTVRAGQDNNFTLASYFTDSGAAVYKLRGGLMNPRRTQP